MARATSSLPVPLSPRITTGLSLAAIRSMSRFTCASLHRFNGRQNVATTGQHDDLDVLVVIAQSQQQIQPIHTRHVLVDDGNMKVLLGLIG